MDARSDIQLDKQHVERIEGAHALPEYVEHLARYRFALQWAPAARVLDVCCGVGYGSFLIAAAGAAHVTGLDLSEEAIAAARRQPSLPNLSFQVADACQPYPEPGTWDLITCFEGIEHVAKPQVLLSWVYDALRPGGVAVISTPNADGYEGGSSGNPFHLAEMSERQFREIVTSFGWNTEWYAQISKQAVWTRPSWQRAVIRRLPKSLRAWRQARAIKRKLPEVWHGISVQELWRLDSDDWYPIPWNTAVSIMYNPPPFIILVVCRRHPQP